METTIKDALPKVLETLAPQTKEEEATTLTRRESSAPPVLLFQTLNDPTLELMAHKAAEFCRDLYANHNPRWLSFLGRSGTGKTHLARRISRYFREHLEGHLAPGQDEEISQWRMRGGFVKWRNLARDLRDGDMCLMRDLSEDWLVVLDDIGAEYKSKSDFLTAKLDELLDSRLGKWTVITSNLGLDQINDFMDARIASRLVRGGSDVLEINAPDFNLRPH